MENGGVVHLQSKGGDLITPRNPNGVDSLQKQEMQHELQSSCYSDEQYSDIGYPTLPRPKAILSLSRATLPWNFHQASTLSTVPVRVRKGSCKTESKLSCVSQCAPTAEQSVKVNRELPQAKQRKRKSLAGIADLFRERSNTAPARQSGEEQRRQCNPISSEPVIVVDQMSDHSKAESTRMEAKGSADGREEASQQKTKKSRKPSKSLTFSFGSSSDRKRRTLGLLGKGEKKNRKTSPIPPAPVTPNSPILVSRRARTLPVNATLVNYEKTHREVPVHPKFNSTQPLRYGSYQDMTGAKSPSRGKYRPPPLRNLTGSVGQHLCHTTTDIEDASPLTDYSPDLTSMSGMSSRPDSIESLPFSAVSESSRTSSLTRETATPPMSRRGVESPQVSRSAMNTPNHNRRKSPAARRKLSDPMLLAPSVDAGTSPQPHPKLGRVLKKRYTFCVRPSRANAEQEWVS